MKFKLINQPNNKYNAKQQVLVNRGIDEKEINHYLNLTDNDLNDPTMFGENVIKDAADCLLQHIDANNKICIVVDCDCDGYTSSAILINYIYDLTSEEWINNHVFWYLHESKQHGLGDCMDWINDCAPDLVIIPDAGSNDTEYIEQLFNSDRSVIILDHHELEVEPSPHCYLINSQLPQYPNKELSGAGVVYQFCKYVSRIRGLEDKHIEDWYYDLTSLGLTGDMMNLKSFETKYLISKGLVPSNIRNPYMYEMWQKNIFKLTNTPTSWGITFYIVPMINAITRSGTLEEKELIFNAMLKFKAFKQVPSTKRGHKLGETERLVDQAVRTSTNVKNRQTREEEKGLELVEHLIKDNNMMEHKVLLFLLEPGAIQPEIRGLIANKLMAKYQRPCCILTKTIAEDGTISYQGSARGCDKVGVSNFKDICAATQVCDYTVGHQGAFGLSITAGKQNEEEGEVFGENILQFLDKTDEILKDMPNEPIYYVDYIWEPTEPFGPAVLDIASLASYWGQGVEESIVAVKNIQVTKDNISMMASNTVKITLPNGVNLIKFRMPDEDYNKLYSETGFVEINAICRCNRNEWNGNVSPQLLVDDYEIVGGCAYVF